jgi:uncharacterized repeat protein (TIGR02059 family)
MKYKQTSRIPVTKVVDFSQQVPFNIACTICEHQLVGDITLTPIQGPGYSSEYYPAPYSKAIYRIVGDGTSSVTFAAPFKQSSVSEPFSNNSGVVNLIQFLFDGVDYWYTISYNIVDHPTTTIVPTTAPVIPVLQSIVVDTENPSNLILTFDSALDENYTPDASAFAVLVNDVTATITNVSVSGLTITLTLSSAIVSGDVVTVSYDNVIVDELLLTFSNIADASLLIEGNASLVVDWNTFWGSSVFTRVTINGNIVNLRGGAGISLPSALYTSEYKPVSIVDTLGAVITLDLSNTSITEPPILTGLTALQILYLTNTSITEPPVLTGLSVLREFSIAQCPALHTADLDTILTYFGTYRENITVVYLGQYPEVLPTTSVLEAAQTANPQCTFLTYID